MGALYDRLMKAYDSIRGITDFTPDIALVLGSGLGDFADTLENRQYISYEDIDGFPRSTVSGHAGKFVLGNIGCAKLVVMQGRVHFYEGYSMEQVVMPVRLMGLMGAKTLLLTNAAGGVNTAFKPGDLMLIKDHISSFVPSCLIGPNEEALGTRFPDMTHVYDTYLSDIVRQTAEDLKIDIKEGVYLQTTGPNYETGAEIKMYRLLGADAVGMSTACEAMAANHMGMKVAGISCITNMAAGIYDKPLNHAEVKEVAEKISGSFTSLIKNSIINIKGDVC